MQGTNDLQARGMELTEGDGVLIQPTVEREDKFVQYALDVNGSHQREIWKAVRQARNVGKHRTIVRLEDDSGDEYHLVCTAKSPHAPILYHESDWENDNPRPGHTTHYTGSGERVESLEIQ